MKLWREIREECDCSRAPEEATPPKPACFPPCRHEKEVPFHTCANVQEGVVAPRMLLKAL